MVEFTASKAITMMNECLRHPHNDYKLLINNVGVSIGHIFLAENPDISEVPSANEERIIDLCEIDLSPGIVT